MHKEKNHLIKSEKFPLLLNDERFSYNYFSPFTCFSKSLTEFIKFSGIYSMRCTVFLHNYTVSEACLTQVLRHRTLRLVCLTIAHKCPCRIFKTWPWSLFLICPFQLLLRAGPSCFIFKAQLSPFQHDFSVNIWLASLTTCWFSQWLGSV